MNTITVWLLRFIMPRQKWYRQQYLQSAHWKRVARKARRRAQHHCEECGQAKPLDVHHRVYWFLFFEQYTMGTLRALCRECHEREHK